ncbi:MAG: nucleotidyl transferase AbiEii/AbiGii toxin family protein [Fibrobacterota bacterium]
MALALKEYFSRQHIEAHKFDASAQLAEQAVYCLELVAELTDCGLDFQFKGGNSLLMILEKPQRFSIDVDIATDASREQIEQCLDLLISKHKTFQSWKKRAHKTKPWLPISSYYLYFRSAFTDEQMSIMLDAQLRKSAYVTCEKKVACGELYRSEKKAVIPYPASIIGDKLLTMGPATLGIPIGRGKQAQRLKHVFDVATLSRMKPSLSRIRDSFYGCLAQENALQDRKINSEQILKDTLSFCGSVVSHRNMPDVDMISDPVLKENITGFLPFAKHLFTSDYRWHNLQIDMSRAALCISAASIGSVTQQQFENALDGQEFHGDTKVKIPVNDLYVQNAWTHIANWLGCNPLMQE